MDDLDDYNDPNLAQTQETTEAFEDRTESINKITGEMRQLAELFQQVN